MLEATSKGAMPVEVPRFSADLGINPFDADTQNWKEGPRLLHKMCLIGCSFRTVAEWQERLKQAEQIIRTNIPKPSVFGAATVVGESITQRFEVGLAFLLVSSNERSDKCSSGELEASVALWFLVRAVLARQEGDQFRSEHFEKQCLWCLLTIFSLKGQSLGVRVEKKRRSVSSSVGGKKRAEPYNRRMALALSDYRRGTWPSKNQASRILGARYALAPTTVRDRLKGI